MSQQSSCGGNMEPPLALRAGRGLTPAHSNLVDKNRVRRTKREGDKRQAFANGRMPYPERWVGIALAEETRLRGSAAPLSPLARSRPTADCARKRRWPRLAGSCKAEVTMAYVQ